MQLDKHKLDNILCNRNVLVISGKLNDSDRKILLKCLRDFNNKYRYVGTDHIEPVFCHDISDNLKYLYKITEDTSILFFKCGFLEKILQGTDKLLYGMDDLLGLIIENFGILPM